LDSNVEGFDIPLHASLPHT